MKARSYSWPRLLGLRASGVKPKRADSTCTVNEVSGDSDGIYMFSSTEPYRWASLWGRESVNQKREVKGTQFTLQILVGVPSNYEKLFKKDQVRRTPKTETVSAIGKVVLLKSTTIHLRTRISL